MKRRRLLRWAGSVVLAVALTGCAPSSDSTKSEPACVRDKTPFELGADTYTDAGKPGPAKGERQPFVVVFDEQHPSRVGQVEIAIMLNRLYHKAKLRNLALEGSVVEQPPPDLTWFTSLPDARIRETVALQLLRQGEVSAAEFAAMVLPGFRLHSIEHDNEYQIDLSDEASSSYNVYLVAIALTTMTPDQNAHADALFAESKDEEAIQFIIDSDPWTKQRDQILQRTTPIQTTEEMRELGSELEAKAREVGADVADYQSDFQDARRFFDMAARRSETMTTRTAELARARLGDCAPIAMNIGAAHTTEAVDLLSQKKMSYAVVSPLSLSADSEGGSLSTEAYDRKLKGQSVDVAGGFGAFLDGRRKPPPSSGQAWFNPKAHLIYATVAIAEAAAAAGGDGQPPFGLDPERLGLGGSGPDAPNITVDLGTMRKVPVQVNGQTRYDVIFNVMFGEENTSLWVRTGVVADVDDYTPGDLRTLERELERIRNELKQEGATGEPKPSKGPQIVTLTPDVRAAIDRNPEVLEAVSLI